MSAITSLYDPLENQRSSYLSYIRGKVIIFDGEYRSKEMDIFFSINPILDPAQRLIYSVMKADGSPVLPDVSEATNATAGNDTQAVHAFSGEAFEKLEIRDMRLGVQVKRSFNLQEEKTVVANVTIADCLDRASSAGKCIDLRIDGVKADVKDANMTDEVTTKIVAALAELHVRLESGNLHMYMANISNYAFLSAMVTIFSFFKMLNVIKQVAENHALAESFSMVSIGMNLVWNFFFFAIHFQFSIQGEGEFMQYLGMPAFWYFICSFTFESRLFIFVWRSQLTQQQMFDEQLLRRRLTGFYIMFYVLCFVAVVFQDTLLYNEWAILLLNATLWIPQIVRSYIRRSRRGPSTQFAIALFALQSFLPLYLKLYPGNFLDQETNMVFAALLILFMAAQLFVMSRQQTHGGRWFVPEKYRRDANQYNYYHAVPESILRKARAKQA